jgi:3-oxoacyl-[acyl-carrier-protein] synthase-3
MQSFHLQHIPKLAVSGQPCSVIHFVVQLAGAWLEAVPEGDVLVLGVDKARSAEERVFFGSTMGDAAIAMLITRRAARHRVMACISQTYSLTFAGENSPPEDIARFRQENPHRIRMAVQQALAEAGMQLGDVSYIIPHTPYTLIWDVTAELLRFPRERILTDYLSETGHLNSNDVFVHFERALREGKISSGQIVVLISPGFGGTRGCTIIRV